MTGHLDLYTPQPNMLVTVVSDAGQTYSGVSVVQMDGRNLAVIDPIDMPDGIGAQVTIGTVVTRGVLWLSKLNPVNASASFAFDTLVSFKPSLPAIPTRAQACSIQMSFQGLTVDLVPEAATPWVVAGPTPWFEAALAALGPVNREIVYAAKHAAGDTHVGSPGTELEFAL